VTLSLPVSLYSEYFTYDDGGGVTESGRGGPHPYILYASKFEILPE